ncbi:hypothetical protein RSPO_c00004 [Ralstonia solanacearum Po82]|uniref:Uncharacterized protein n=1 Tax=Ralstonia solanacearum (strain Po82) TaxID=1031711 RepID=F6G4P8_RALS8|nr:hypothetical protein RSPO_c00004 [Ralstonia solanacearum Po82]
MGVGRTWRGCLKTAKGRIFSIQPLVLFSMFLSRLRWASLVKSASA